MKISKISSSAFLRRLSIFCAVIASSFFLIGKTQAQVLAPFSDSWENYSVGNAPSDNWSGTTYATVQLNNGTTGSFPPPAPAGGESPNEKVLYQSRPDDGGYAFYRDFTTGSGGLTTGIYQASFQIYYETEEAATLVRIMSADGTAAAMLQFSTIGANDRVRIFTNGSYINWEAAGTFVTGKWYEFTLTIDMDTKLVTYEGRNLTDSIDFATQTNLAFAQNTNVDIERFMFSGNDTIAANKYYLNDVSFSQIPEPTVLGLAFAAGSLCVLRRRYRKSL